MFSSKNLAQLVQGLETLMDIVNVYHEDRGKEAHEDVKEAREALNLFGGIVNKLTSDHELYDRNKSFIWDSVDMNDTWMRYFMAQHDIRDEDEVTSHPEWVELTENQIEMAFLNLNENDTANQGVRDGMIEVFDMGFNKYNIGDEVYWNDPDNGACSGYALVNKLQYLGGNFIYSLKNKDGGEIEAFEHELS